MSKRCQKFKRRKQDAYDTPPEAVAPLLPHLPDICHFWEPCAGRGLLRDALKETVAGQHYASDIEPRPNRDGVVSVARLDAMQVSRFVVDSMGTDYIITNPPWTREILHPMIDHFRSICPTWLLFDADWMHTKQAEPYLKYCHKIVSVGRVSWMQNGTSSLDNCAWYLFKEQPAETLFIGRAA